MLSRDQLFRSAIVWITCLVVVSLQPIRPFGGGESPSMLHRAGHILSFGTAGLMLLVLSKNRKKEWTAVLAVLCLAVGIESAQHLLYRGPFEWWDVREDAIGLVTAGLLTRWTRVRPLLLYEPGL
jgi:hypothetical protein